MKRTKAFIAVLMVFAMIFMVTGCGKKEGNQLVGVWEYSDTENGIGAVYDLKADGTGTYTMTVGDQEVVYELKYEVKDSHLLVTYVNNDVFSEDDVFDSEFSLKDEKTLIIKDTSGQELEFIKK